MRRALISVTVVCGLLVAAGAYFARAHTASATKTERASVPYWEARIQSVGPARAYQELTRALTGLSPDEQHGDAHVFGSALYARVGVDGMRICDSKFSYGCYHELVGEAIAGHGVSIISALEQGCDSATGCEHGIGHGLVGSLGYTPDALDHAIDVCEKLAYGPIDGCLGGAFMEYSMRTLADPSGRTETARPLDSSGLLAPCDSYTGRAEESCALLQPQWWSEVLSSSEVISGEKLFGRMGELCARFKAADTVRACFEGAGWIAAALAQYDPAAAARLCDATSEEALERLYCRSFAAQLFPSVGLSVDEGVQVCDGLAADAKGFCTTYAAGKASTKHPIPAPQIP